MTTKSVVSSCIRWSGTGRLVRRFVARRRISILVYHDPPADVMAAHLAYLRPRYNGVSLSAALHAIRTAGVASLPSYPLVITFDDGMRGNAAAAELCYESGFPPTIFACSQIVGTSRHYWWTEADEAESLKALPTSQRLLALKAHGFALDREYDERQALSRDEIAALAEHVEFGAHTRFHPILTMSTEDEAWSEIGRARSEIAKLTGRPCEHFAYPNGDYGSREVAMVKRAGYLSARTVDVGWNTRGSDPYRLRCLPTVDDASIDRLAADLSGAGFLWRWKWTGKWNGRHPTILPKTLEG